MPKIRLGISMNNEQIITHFGQVLLKEKKIKQTALITFIGLVSSTGLSLLSPYILSYVIESLINASTTKLFLYLSTYLFTLIAGQATSNYFYYTCNKLGLAICSSIQLKVISTYLEADDVTEEHANYFVDCLIGDINQIAQSFYNLIAVGLSNFLMIIGLIMIFLTFNYVFGTAIFILFIGILYIQKIKLSTHVDYWVNAKNSQSQTQATLACGINSHSQFIHHAYVNYFKELIKKYSNKWFKLHQHALVKSIHSWSITYGITIFFSGFGIWQLWKLNSSNYISIGTLFMYLEYINNIQTPLEDVSHLGIEFHQITSCLQRINQRLQKYQATRKNVELVWPEKPYSLSFENVSFDYLNDGKFIIENLYATFPAKKITKVAGPSGCGKSSLLDIIYGIKNDYKGNVYINDTNIKKFSCRTRKKYIGYLSQFSKPVGKNLLENISRYDPTITAAVCIKKAEILGLAQIIDKQPLKLLTPIEEHNHETKMLCLISSLIRFSILEQSILLIDEPLVAIDDTIQDSIINALKILSKNKTVLLISHSDKIDLLADQTVNIINFNKRFHN